MRQLFLAFLDATTNLKAAVQALGADEFKTREAASKKLVAAGT